MSVGGKVIDIVRRTETVWINTDDGFDECAIYVYRDTNSERVSIGDSVWWQGRSAYWSTIDGAEKETELKRYGYSGVKRPVLVKSVQKGNAYG